MLAPKLTRAELELYHLQGYIIIKGLCKPNEINKLYSTALKDNDILNNGFDLNDQSGKKTRLSLWFTPGNDVFGYLTRSERIIGIVKQLLDGDAPVCHYHSKLMQKQPKDGGAWEWHQDYGYWYKNQFMFPDQLISVMVALTEASKQNGCLQVLKGSHKLGRLNHGFAGEQMEADPQMVNNALKTMELVYVELEPGDAVIFHSNLLHRSGANLSDHPRWSIISCYNLQSNLAYNETSSSYKVPVNIVTDNAVMDWDADSLSNADFLKKENDPALKKAQWENA